MIIEALTFKLTLDFFIYLKKNRITTSDIRLKFLDKVQAKSEFVTYASVDALQDFYDKSYVPLDPCFLGDLVSIEFFRGTSDLYGFENTYTASDIVGAYSLKTGSSFDGERNAQRKVLSNRQKGFIDKSVEEYREYFEELKEIYVTGIYSPCYAVPGWSQGTWYLNELRKTFTDTSGIGEFPYVGNTATKNPPK